MLPPPNPSPPKALILEPELNAIAICLRVRHFLFPIVILTTSLYSPLIPQNAAVKTNQIHAFFADTKRL